MFLCFEAGKSDAGRVLMVQFFHKIGLIRVKLRNDFHKVSHFNRLPTSERTLNRWAVIGPVESILRVYLVFSDLA